MEAGDTKRQTAQPARRCCSTQDYSVAGSWIHDGHCQCDRWQCYYQSWIYEPQLRLFKRGNALLALSAHMGRVKAETRRTRGNSRERATYPNASEESRSFGSGRPWWAVVVLASKYILRQIDGTCRKRAECRHNGPFGRGTACTRHGGCLGSLGALYCSVVSSLSFCFQGISAACLT